MPINMNCPSCGNALIAPDSAVGKRAKCPPCGQVMVVPAQALSAELAPLTGTGDAWPRDGYFADRGFAGTQAAPAGAGEVRRPCPACGQSIMAAAAKCRFCGVIFDPRLRGAAYRRFCVGRGSPDERARRIRSSFTTMWSSIVLGPMLFVATIAVGGAQKPEFLLVAICTAGVVMLVGMISYLVLLYRLWSVVQDGRARTTPGSAASLMLVPCFNVYWQFVAVWGLSKELNRIRREHGFAAPPANEGLALTACIVHCCGWVPQLHGLALLPWLIISTVELKSMCNTAVAIVSAAVAPVEAAETILSYPVRGPNYAY